MTDTPTPHQSTETRLRELENIKEIFDQLTDNLTDVFWIVEDTWKFVYVSPAYEKIWGASCQSLYDDPVSWLEIIHPEDRERLKDSYANLFEEPTNIEYRIILKDGSIRHLKSLGYYIYNEEGKPYRIVGTTIDITDRKQAEETQKHLMAIIEATTDFIGMTDKNGYSLYTNRAGRKICNIGADEDMSHMHISDFHTQADFKHIMKEALPCALKNNVWSGEIEILTSDGRKVPMHQVIIAHKSPHGEVEYFSTIMRDISERKQAEEELRKHRNQIAAIEKFSAVGEMTAAIAHELNQPIAAIANYARGCLWTLRSDKPETNKIMPVVEDIIVQAERAGNIMRNIRSSFEKGSIEKQPVCLANLLAETIQHIKDDLEKSNIEINDDFKDVNVTVLVDSVQIEQVIMNLLNNAIDAMTAHDCTTREINLAIESDEMVTLSISDSGPGIGNEHLKKVFDPLFTTKKKGMGLGLSITKSIIEAHDGEISVTSSPKGTCFTIKLPNQ